jgi:hypothetical protein
MRALQLALIYVNWAGSVLFGWLQIQLWLVVPVAAWASFAFGATAAIQKYQAANGVQNSRYARTMLGPNIRLIARNAGLNLILLAIAWTLSALTGAMT